MCVLGFKTPRMAWVFLVVSPKGRKQNKENDAERLPGGVWRFPWPGPKVAGQEAHAGDTGGSGGAHHRGSLAEQMNGLRLAGVGGFCLGLANSKDGCFMFFVGQLFSRPSLAAEKCE